MHCSAHPHWLDNSNYVWQRVFIIWSPYDPDVPFSNLSCSQTPLVSVHPLMFHTHTKI
jgi:hypothetical protein